MESTHAWGPGARRHPEGVSQPRPPEGFGELATRRSTALKAVPFMSIVVNVEHGVLRPLERLAWHGSPSTDASVRGRWACREGDVAHGRDVFQDARRLPFSRSASFRYRSAAQ